MGLTVLYLIVEVTVVSQTVNGKEALPHSASQAGRNTHPDEALNLIWNGIYHHNHHTIVARAALQAVSPGSCTGSWLRSSSWAAHTAPWPSPSSAVGNWRTKQMQQSVWGQVHSDSEKQLEQTCIVYALVKVCNDGIQCFSLKEVKMLSEAKCRLFCGVVVPVKVFFFSSNIQTNNTIKSLS